MHLLLTSKNALVSTIKTDPQVRRWFSYLIVQPLVQEELSKSEEIKAAYKRIENISRLEMLTYVLLLCAVTFLTVTRKYEYYVFTAGFFIVHIFLHIKKKKSIIQISSFLILRDYDMLSFAQKTLYQIGEIYSRKYHITPLLSALTYVGSITRKAVFYALIFATFIYPLKFWQMWGSVLAVYYIFYGLVSVSFIYKRIK